MQEMVCSGVGPSRCRESIALRQRQSFGLAVCNMVSVPAWLSISTLKRRKGNPVSQRVSACCKRLVTAGPCALSFAVVADGGVADHGPGRVRFRPG